MLENISEILLFYNIIITCISLQGFDLFEAECRKHKTFIMTLAGAFRGFPVEFTGLAQS